MIRVLHCVGSLAPQSGGPARTVTALTDNLAAQGGCSVILLTQNLCNDAVVAADPESRVNRRLAYSHSGLKLKTGWPLKRLLNTVICEGMPTLLHDHGLWLPSNHYVAVVARKYGIPLLIHPRGMLEPWALQHRGWKKRLALWLYQRRDLETAALFFCYRRTGSGEHTQARFSPTNCGHPEWCQDRYDYSRGCDSERCTA